MLRLEGVVKSFGGKRAVDQVSLVVPAGQLLGVIGQSGSGKSTLLRMINRLGDPTAGQIRFGDTDVTALRGRALRQWRGRLRPDFPPVEFVRPPPALAQRF